MRRYRFGVLSAFFICILSLSAADRAAAFSFDQVFVFGDSLSDTGNVFAGSAGTTPDPTAYFEGRFSNGPVWVEPLAGAFGFDLTNLLAAPDPIAENTNFSFGGSQTGIQNSTPDGMFDVPGLNGQVGAFAAALGPRSANPNALYIIWSGANDYIVPPPLLPPESATNVRTAITALYGLGARHFLVANLPDLGKTPLAQLLSASVDPNAADNLTNASTAFNGLLETELASLRNSLPDIKIVDLDVSGLLNAILAKPRFFGFTDPAALPAFGAGPARGCLITFIFPICGLTAPDAAQGFVWYDEQHPTQAVHDLIGASAYIAVKCHREDFTRRGPYIRCVVRAARTAVHLGLIKWWEKAWLIWRAVRSNS